MGEMKCPTCGYTRQVETPTGRFTCPNCQKMIVYDSAKYEKHLREKIKREDEAAVASSLTGLTEAEKKSSSLSAIAIGMSAIGIFLIGGIFLTIPGFIVAVVAWTRKEPKGKYAAGICGAAVAVNILASIFLSALTLR